MKKQACVIAVTYFLLLSSSSASADPSVSESGLIKAIHDRVEEIQAANAQKYDRVVELAGDQRNELSAKKDSVIKAYNEWHELKAKANLPQNGDTANFKELENAAEKYAQASKEFVEMQNGILAQNGIPPGGAISAEELTRQKAASPKLTSEDCKNRLC